MRAPANKLKRMWMAAGSGPGGGQHTQRTHIEPALTWIESRVGLLLRPDAVVAPMGPGVGALGSAHPSQRLPKVNPVTLELAEEAPFPAAEAAQRLRNAEDPAPVTRIHTRRLGIAAAQGWDGIKAGNGAGVMQPKAPPAAASSFSHPGEGQMNLGLYLCPAG